ncbi:macrolide ABC transporter ATP-binding protein [Paenibacillus sp. FSL H7-0357]|uniref:ABC transporter ATP-binding protein n=1 Tax=Paenibacillus sp. FSL H7-0357 TaxID=1536774 RepID=UPI0004F916BC|nr:ABC transporter ATP-binding protein [Paenibacillus sp. FSL H7-0357]AIQ16658.1 macrolide ABC transporter ATP-binding protein [Paenibacillus sp. FSL H7-0357]
MTTLISLTNVVRSYQVGAMTVNAVDGLDFTIEVGEFVVILGPSGSGKSTLLNLLGGMDKASSGQIVIDQNNIADYTTAQLGEYRRKDVGFVFQFYNLIPNLTARENVDVAKKLSDNSLNAAAILKAVGLEERMDHFPGELSGGEQQRVSIARAICKNPKLLLCDEPTGALDSTTGELILSTLWDMSKANGQTVIVVTHNAAIAKAANKVIHLKDGKVMKVQINETPVPMSEVAW